MSVGDVGGASDEACWAWLVVFLWDGAIFVIQDNLFLVESNKDVWFVDQELLLTQLARIMTVFDLCPM